MSQRYVFRAHPSLALIKYWGKSSLATNLPLTSSMAMAINRFTTTVGIELQSSAAEESVTCDGRPTPPDLFAKNYRPFLEYCRRRFKCPRRFWAVTIENNYPLAAGLASSSAIFAALTLAINTACAEPYGRGVLSAIARHGSASAARAVFGGVVCLPARRSRAHRYIDADYWPELRLIVVRCAQEQKPISSRAAMAHSKRTSALFGQWRRKSVDWYRDARRAMADRDLERLGQAMQQSYLTMFATMHTARPAIFYWNEHSIAVIKQCQRLRAEGIPLWETMDAGPQVKILTTERHVDQALRQLRAMDRPSAAEVADADSIPSAMGQPLAPFSADGYAVSELGAPPEPAAVDSR